jgi:hypothetical protein
MNTTLPIPTRYLAVIGIALLAGVLFLVMRPALLGSDDDAAPTATPAPALATPKPAVKPTAPEPKLTLLPGLPAKVANKLRYSKVIVVSLYQGSARGDRSALAAARTGARSAGAGFLPVNVLDEASARAVQTFVGDTSTPATVVVRRPGRIVTSLEGAPSADEQLVAQAARNAGAARR